ncbi:uncharacterized protein BO80DRAFT_416212 [Aspergillus ibericus CBS 121593]|uniref:Uncharacterized protein n=1 Tax=Aspergillus ibericus CBS 121593 TaxID=1448316 RepID=A0A395GMU8_9EURO|nr:hypothetical protein BO80DRAFT_416212 [Aspergillus ibericus CBS 121593]RAK96704.1 hypothetical protein BO80DRAFT_416212 [Aspergillus ibericus CBS 121593]
MRSITSFFKRPDFSIAHRDAQSNDRGNDTAPAAQSSPLAEVPSSLHSTGPSSDDPASQLNLSLSQSVKDDEGKADLLQSFLSTGSTNKDPSPGTSFNSSQRVVKKGKEVIISSDGEDTDSISSFESPDDIFMSIAKPTASVGSSELAKPGMSLGDRDAKSDKRSGFPVSAPKYKYTLDSLVVQAVDDNETEAGIAKLRAAFEKENLRMNEKQNATVHGSSLPSTRLNEGVLASALGAQDDELGLRRLLDAVRRTEALDLEKSWQFFVYKSELPPALEFPGDCIKPESYMAGLRERHSRERAFHSGIVDFALSRSFLPDVLISWIFQAVPSEPQDSIRQAYCRAFKHANAERIKTLIRPNDISRLFEQLGASPKALAVSETIFPDAHVTTHDVKTDSPREGALLSVFDLLCGAAELFADDTRERALNLLFRLTLDVSLTRNALICSELERTIVTMLESAPENTADDLVLRVGTSAFDTIKDATLQSRLLRHILPASDWLATLRCRLAISFLMSSPLPLREPPEKVLNLERITSILNQPRFDVKRYKSKGQNDYDYGELGAITVLLNIAIDAGRSEAEFPDKDAERDFNAAVDTLADRLKIIFTSIEDSGASHLKRTLAKEAIEALHYRVIYSVRSKPRPKKSIFGVPEPRRENQKVWKSFTAVKKDGDGLPIRAHEHEF